MSGGVSSGRLRGASGGSGQPNGATVAPNGGAAAQGVVRAASGITKPEADVWYVNVEGDAVTGPLTVEGRLVALDPAVDNALSWTEDGLYAPPPAAIPEEYLTEGEADLRYQLATEKGQPDGYAALDGAGLIPSANLPPLAISETFVVASEAEQLALDCQVGDVAIRSDLDQTFILGQSPASTLANWYLLGGTVTGVSSVNGETGNVLLDAADVGALDEATADGLYAPLAHTHPAEESGPWRFQDNTTIANPGAGYMRCDTGNLATASILSFSRTTQDGYDIPPPGWGLAADDTIYIQDRDDSTKWVRYTALEPLVRFPTYATGLVEVESSAGAIVNGQIVQVTFSLAGGGGGGGGAGGSVASDTVWDAKGDLAAGTGADTAARLAVGSNGQLLSADSAAATGLAWVANPVTAHAALPNAHHAQAHDHTAADGSGALTNEAHDGYSQYANLGADPSTPGTNTIRLYSKDNGSGIATLYYRTEDGTIYELPTFTSGGGGGSGAPANGTYITTTAEAKLSAERVLGTAVIMSGTLASRPAFGTAGRLYLATDTDTVTRDTGSAWETFATRAVGSLATDPLADAKGDLFAASAANTIGRLPVGSDDQVLTADATQALGVRWATPAEGEAGMTDPTTTTGDLIVRAGAAAEKHLNPTLSGTRSDTTLTYGQSFSVSVAGYLTQLKFFRHSLSTTHYGVQLWILDNTTAVAGSTNSADWAGYGSVGWATYTLPTPLAVTTGVTYIVSTTYTGTWTGPSGGGAVDSPLANVGQRYHFGFGVTTPTYPEENGGGGQGLGVDVTYRQSLGVGGPERLPVGTDGQVVTADSAQLLGVKWGGAGALAGTNTTSATGGSATALPSQPVGYVTLVINGTARRLAYYS